MTALEEQLRPHLDPGEKLLWSGRPVQGPVFTATDFYYLPFSIVWLGLLLTAFARRMPPDPTSQLIVPCFIALGVYMLVGRYFTDWFYRSGVIYGVTDRRAIILSSRLGHSIKSIDLASVSGLKLDERRDGHGTIAFGDQQSYWYRQPVRPAWGAGPQFFRIADTRRVFRVLHEAMQRQKGKV